MSSVLKVAQMVLGGLCVLLLAGGFPLAGAEGVYRSGAMLLLGGLVLLLSLWGTFRLASGRYGQLIFGLLFLFFACTGVLMVGEYGSKAVEYAMQGGAMWAGAVGMGCTALVGVVFLAVFGYLCKRVMNHSRLWLAGLHAAIALLVLGVYTDAAEQVRVSMALPADGRPLPAEVSTPSGEKLPLGFRLQVDEFTVRYYDDAHYALYPIIQGRPGTPQAVERRGERLHLGAESWAVASLQQAPGMPRPFRLLPGNPPRVLVEEPGTVRDYCASCTLHTDYKGRPETRRETLRVNEPIRCKGWLVYLNSYRAGNPAVVQLELRRAPGRVMALSGIVGIMVCSAVWCWSRKEETAV